MLECPKCAHDNDLGRIFCVKCGEKLDISKVGAPSGVKRRAKKGGRALPLGSKIGNIIQKFVKVIVLAAVGAFLTLVWLPPDFQGKGFDMQNLEAFQEKRVQLEDAVNARQKGKIVFEEGDLNAAMAQAVKSTLKAAGESKGPQLESIYISLGQGAVVVTVQQKWKWFRLTVQARARPQNEDGKWKFRADQAWIGRFPIPAWAPVQLKDRIYDAFGVIWKSLSTEQQWLEEMQSVDVQPGKLVLSTQAGS